MSNKIAIVILNWNNWKYTVSCIESLLNSNTANSKIILIDNASTDDSLLRIREKYQDITILKNKRNLGFGAGNNVGIKYALEQGFEYIWLLNNDTTVVDKSLSSMLELMEAKSNLGMVGSVLYNMQKSETLQTYGGGKLYLKRCYTVPCKLGEEPDYITAASVLIRSQALSSIDLFNEIFFMYWEDVDLCLRIKAAGWGVAVADDSIIYHAEGVSSTSFKKEYYSFISGIYFSWKYSPCFLSTFIVGFVYDRLLKRICFRLLGLNSIKHQV